MNKGAGFIFHSFNSEKNFFLNELRPIPVSSFEMFFNNDERVITSKSNYIETCQEIIDKISTTPIQKIVFSRIQKEKYEQDALLIFSKLNQAYAHSFNFIISIENVGTWMGATPEQFLKIENEILTTVSLAGTKLDPNLKWGEKELMEQQIVSDFIAAQLNKNKCENITIEGPKTINTGVVSHLKTTFNTNVQYSNLRKIIKDLHPTPATCGLPKNAALKEILEFEQHKRKYYTGFLGLVDSNELDLFVNLRCMEIDEHYAYLYLGGGITKDSEPISEWNETLHKAKTLSQFLN